jgi:hypothetical protein
LVGREATKDATDTALEKIASVENTRGWITTSVNFDDAGTEEDAEAANVGLLTEIESVGCTGLEGTIRKGVSHIANW